MKEGQQRKEMDRVAWPAVAFKRHETAATLALALADQLDHTEARDGLEGLCAQKVRIHGVWTGGGQQQPLHEQKMQRHGSSRRREGLQLRFGRDQSLA